MQTLQRRYNIILTPTDYLLLLGVLGLGMLLAYLIAYDVWSLALVLVVAVPLGVPAIVLLVRRPFVAIVLWLLLSPFFQATPTYAGRLVFWMLHRAMIPAVLGMVVLLIALNPKQHKGVKLGRAELAMAAFMGIVTGGILLQQTDVTATLILLYDRVFVPFCVYLLVRLTAPRAQDLELLLWIAMITLVTQTCIGLMSWFAPELVPHQWLGLQGARTTGTLRHPSAFGVTLIFCIVLLYQAAMNRKGASRLIFLFGCGLGAIGIFLSFGRGPWLGGLFAIMGLLALYPKPTIRMAVILLLVVAILGGGVLTRQTSFADERLNDKNTTNARIIIADAMLTMIQIKPLFGWGYELADLNAHQFYPTRVGDIAIGREFQPSHNTYLTIITETGLVGFSLFIFPLVWYLVLTIRVWRRIPPEGFWSQTLLVSLWIIIGGFIIPSNFTDMRFWPFITGLWWLTIGLIANVVHPYLQKDRC